MRTRGLIPVFLITLALPGAAAAGEPDVCSLLDDAAIRDVQGEAPLRAKAQTRQEAGYGVQQCFWTLPSHTLSISLQVTRHPEAGAVPARWQALFHDQDNGGKTGAPRSVAGVGDDAFWAGNAEVSGLYVLDGENLIRVAVGGGLDEDDRIQRTVTLSRSVLARLQAGRRGR